ncbi:MAG: alkaline phosphatase family protein [Bryobacteraceae bacterium]|nr:alkaline phosphatase family protein [Bryobacteraceae bacterium]
MRDLIRIYLFLAACMAFGQPTGRRVVIISIDGFAAYSLKDPALPIPHLRGLAAEGAAAEAMTPVNPTVTWPNHTSLVTGVRPALHSVLYNGQAQRQGEGKPLKVEPWIPKDELVAAPTLYDVAHAAKLTTAEVDWVAIHKPRTITWAFPEVPSSEGGIEREMAAAGLVTTSEIAGFSKLPILFRDEIWTRAAEHILMRHKPNLLLFHLLTTDSLQHSHGARSLAGNTALALADAKVGRILEALRRANTLERTTIFVVSDHGFKTVRHLIQPNALFAASQLGGAAWAIPEGGTAMVYVTRSEGKPETIGRIRTLLKDVQGISRILTPVEFAEFGYPTPERNSRMADLVLAAAEGYAFNSVANGPVVVPVADGASPGSHGYLNTDPEMDAIFIAAGPGIRKGVRLGRIRNLDVAPTAAKLLGVRMENTEGRVLNEILR